MSKIITGIDLTLERLSTAFTVRDLMIPKNKLVLGKSEQEAKAKLLSQDEYDVIPIEQAGKITSYFERARILGRVFIGINVLMSDGTSILDAIDLLKDRPFYFVLAKGTVEGLVHFSDLNNSVVKIPLFVMLESVERHLAMRIAADVNESNLAKVLGPHRAEELKRRMAHAKKTQTNRSWVNVLTFAEILRYARHFDKIDIQETELQSLANVRNRISHADKRLVESHAQVKDLAEAKKMCFSILTDLTYPRLRRIIRGDRRKPAIEKAGKI